MEVTRLGTGANGGGLEVWNRTATTLVMIIIIIIIICLSPSPSMPDPRHFLFDRGRPISKDQSVPEPPKRWER